jgi:protease IV
MEKRNGSKFIIPIALVVGCLPWLMLFGLVAVLIIGGIAGLAFSGSSSLGGDQIALIHLSGVITAGEGGGGLFDSSVGSESVIKQLERARKDKSIKAIILRINSPGGSPAGSQEVYDEIMKIRKDGKIVVTSMGDLAASGGYYIASASDKIYADGSTITGSIGVIYQGSNMVGLYKKIGIQPQVLKTGKYKDTGSPARELRPDEKKLIQDMLNDTFQQFIKAVSDGRKMPVAKVRSLADGRVFTGLQAKKLGLVDEIGGLQDVKMATAKMAGIKGEPKVTEYDKGFWDAIGASSDTDSESLKVDGKDLAMVRRLLQVAPELLK